jgi:hypothetical protein
LYNFFLQEHVAVVDAEDAAVADFPDLTGTDQLYVAGAGICI